MAKISIRFFNDREVRAVWDDATNGWFFSVLDVVGVLNGQDDYAKNRNYWKWLKAKLKREGNQLVSATTQLRLTAADGKKYRSDVGQGRLLIVSPVVAARTSAATAAARNRWILANCTSLVLGSLDPNGNLARLVASFPRNHITCLQDIPSGQENL